MHRFGVLACALLVLSCQREAAPDAAAPPLGTVLAALDPPAPPTCASREPGASQPLVVPGLTLCQRAMKITAEVAPTERGAALRDVFRHCSTLQAYRAAAARYPGAFPWAVDPTVALISRCGGADPDLRRTRLCRALGTTPETRRAKDRLLMSLDGEPIKLAAEFEFWRDEQTLAEIPDGTPVRILETGSMVVPPGLELHRARVQVRLQGRTLEGWVNDEDLGPAATARNAPTAAGL